MVQSTQEPQVSVKLQGKLLINFNVVQTPPDEDSNRDAGYKYDQVKVALNSTRGQIIEAIIGTKYSTGAEIALQADKDDKVDEYQAYQDMRTMAKQIASTVQG